MQEVRREPDPDQDAAGTWSLATKSCCGPVAQGEHVRPLVCPP